MNAATIMKKSRSNFAWAFVGLSKAQRRALQALYAYCRIVDDIVDEPRQASKAEEEIRRWRGYVDRVRHPSVFDPHVLHELSKACQTFPIELADLHWILDGVEMDLHIHRYQTIEQLLSYCDGVASAVGLTSMAIFGGERKSTTAYAVATGRALQLTNILRDVASDAKRGRIYLPQSDMERFGYREKDLLRSVYDERFTMLMSFEAARAKSYYQDAENALPVIERKKFPAAEIMRRTYQALLQRIEGNRYNVFPQKIRLSPPTKMAIAVSVWAPHFFRPASV
ncbi:MAG TPA: phytoene/squalene synthase family protein [Bdellovibrionota bacterium]|nr:phytoene/squalene synthase family protein [Bdellovibrionota bacterium]